MVLRKQSGSGSSSSILGLKVVGGKLLEDGSMGAVIEKVKKGSTADIEGQLRPGKNELNLIRPHSNTPYSSTTTTFDALIIHLANIPHTARFTTRSSSIKYRKLIVESKNVATLPYIFLFEPRSVLFDSAKSQVNKIQVVGGERRIRPDDWTISGDEVIKWNGRSLQGKSFGEVYDIIAESRQDPQVELVVSRNISSTAGPMATGGPMTGGPMAVRKTAQTQWRQKHPETISGPQHHKGDYALRASFIPSLSLSLLPFHSSLDTHALSREDCWLFSFSVSLLAIRVYIYIYIRIRRARHADVFEEKKEKWW